MTETEVLTPWDRVRAHFSVETWLHTIHLAVGLPLAVLGGVVILGLAALSVALVWTVAVPIVALPLAFLAIPLFTRLQRGRFAAYLGVDIAALPALPALRNPLKRMVRAARRTATWRQLGYHVLALLISTVGFLTVVMGWTMVLVCAFVAVRIVVAGGEWFAVLPLLAALLLLAVVPWAARGLVALDVMAAETLLGPSLSDLLVQRVETLQESRTEVIDAADAERRRIERDLHDGAQQRLVSLAMNLGMARASLTDLPEPAKEVLAQAHEEAKLALKELRDFVRGLHPAVLNDEGLDAALSGLAARASLPVRLTVDVSERASPTIEAVAFFVVSETLTNIAKHAQATRGEIIARRADDRLLLLVRDDGRGGAGLGANGGTGLRGLAQRVGSVDGALRIDSPVGGPTTIEVNLPCE